MDTKQKSVIRRAASLQPQLSRQFSMPEICDNMNVSNGHINLQYDSTQISPYPQINGGFGSTYEKPEYENWAFTRLQASELNNSEVAAHKKLHMENKLSDDNKISDENALSTCDETQNKLAYFSNRTTAHGWGQVVHEKRIILQLIWVVFTISAYVGNGWHVSLLVKQYLDYPTEQIARVQFTAVQFPSITICNIQPMSLSTGFELYNNKSTKLYYWDNLTSNYLTLYNASSLGITEDQYEYLTNRLVQPVGYFENIGDEAQVVGQQIEDFLIRCTFPSNDCGTENFTFYQNPSYFNCYTFNSDANSSLIAKTTGPQQGLSMILYLESDNGDMLYNGTYHTLSNIGNAAGIRVVIHSPGTLPTPVDTGIDLSPGYSSSIGIKVTQAERLEPPIGTCRKDLTFIDNYIYSQQGCLLLCQQSHVIRTCSCISSQLPIPLAQDGNYRYCGEFNMSDPVYFFDNLSCEANVSQYFASDDNMQEKCDCFPPCDETAYQTDISYSYWPLDFSQDDFYTKYVIDNPERDNLKAYNNLKHFNTTDLIQNGLIRKNFARVNIYLKDLIVEEVIQKRTYELQNLFSDMGGTFGLWIGVSILTWFEIFELFIKLIVFWITKMYAVLLLNRHGQMNGNGINHYD